jgi:dTMP kinase
VSARWQYYGKGLPYLTEHDWPGHLLVVEGADGCGRSTQIALLKDWLERRGHAVLSTGLRRSALASEMITRAKQGNLLGRTTLSLLYATDLADQLENRMIPALRAGFVVLADRYIYSMMARDLVRGADRHWLEQLFGFALRPDLVIYLHTLPEERLHRTLAKSGALDYWESGMDLGLAHDRFSSYLQYQGLLQEQYDRMQAQYGFTVVDGSAPREDVHKAVCKLVRSLPGPTPA